MTHPDDELLAASALGEGSDDERGAVLAHAAECRRCAAELEALRTLLDATTRIPVPEREETYGARVWASLEPRLPSPEDLKRTESPLQTAPRASRAVHAAASWRSWLAAAAVLIAVTGAFMLGRRVPAPPDHVTTARSSTAATPDPASIRQRVVLAALADHLDRTERRLVELVNADADGTVDVSAERAWARELLDANRLYRQSVRGSASPALADLLDELEPVLLDIVHSPERIPAREFDALRSRIEDRSLVFKVRATETDVRARQRMLRRPGDQTS
jgi:hypothetical protein